MSLLFGNGDGDGDDVEDASYRMPGCRLMTTDSERRDCYCDRRG
jgi:hypothetical protein